MKRRFFSALLSAFLLTVSTTGLTAFAEESSLPEATEKILTESVPTSEAPVNDESSEVDLNAMFAYMEGLSDDVIMERYADFFAARASMKEDLPYPGGENAADVIRRAVPVMDEIVKSGAETVAVVTHGGVIRSLVTHYLHMDGAYVPLLAKQLENCGITEFYYRESDGEMLLNRFNDFAHLMDEPELLRGGWGEKK